MLIDIIDIHKKLNVKQRKLLSELALFFTAIIGFHILYLFWSQNDFRPLQSEVTLLFNVIGKLLFNQSNAVIHIIGIEHIEKGSTFYIKNFGSDSVTTLLPYLEVSPGCTSLKQWMHWIFLMLIFPGPWLRKLWYIPSGIIILHLMNIVRIVGLAIVLSINASRFHFFHDTIFKIAFYSLIFLMWLIWVEKLAIRR